MGLGFDVNSVLRCTEKAMNAALLIQERCKSVHGRRARDAIGSEVNGGRYTTADLKYDLKTGRLQTLPPGTAVPEIPEGKPRPDAPFAGKKMPAASLDEFFCFLQNQLVMEAKQHTGEELKLSDKDATKMWPYVEEFITPNLGLTERWVPYHTILGVHEEFLVKSVHSQKQWNEKQRFLAMFIFRAHCKRDLFTKAQVPIMLQKSFWQDPQKAFQPGGPMEKAILRYRKTTGQPLLTSCFRIIPPRVLKDNDANLVRSITNRTMALLDVAEQAYPVAVDKKIPAGERMDRISSMIQEAQGCGETWAKMLTVCIDLAYPQHHFLDGQCDVGTGAAPPLKVLLKRKQLPENKVDALKDLQKAVNSASSSHAKEFRSLLKKEESMILKKFKAYPLICAQAHTKNCTMTAATLQVQLCEYRQFRHAFARNQYGLPDDETMRCDMTQSRAFDPEHFIEFDKKGKCYSFEYPKDGKKIKFQVAVKAFDNEMVAKGVAYKCFDKFIKGGSNGEVCKFRDELQKNYSGDKRDVPATSEAWQYCATQLSHSSPVCAFQFEGKDGKKQPFQTTVMAANGSVLHAERIARLCWEKLKSGMKKDAVLKYREGLYEELKNEGKGSKRASAVAEIATPQKRRRVN